MQFEKIYKIICAMHLQSTYYLYIIIREVICRKDD